jgi:hypothetical protein
MKKDDIDRKALFDGGFYWILSDYVYLTENEETIVFTRQQTNEELDGIIEQDTEFADFESGGEVIVLELPLNEFLDIFQKLVAIRVSSDKGKG